MGFDGAKIISSGMVIAQASESSGTGRMSRATVKIPVLGSTPKFTFETYSLKIDQVLIPL